MRGERALERSAGIVRAHQRLANASQQHQPQPPVENRATERVVNLVGQATLVLEVDVQVHPVSLNWPSQLARNWPWECTAGPATLAAIEDLEAVRDRAQSGRVRL